MDVKRKGAVISANLLHTNRRRLRSVLLRYLAMIARSSRGNCIFAGQSRTMVQIELVIGWSGQNLDPVWTRSKGDMFPEDGLQVVFKDN